MNDEEKSDDNRGDQATRSANEEKSDDISSAAATSKKSGVIAAPKPRASKRGVQKRLTTARNLSTYMNNKKRAICKKRARVKIRRDNLFHILKSEKQKDDIQKYINSRNFHEDIISGNGNQGYNIKFDDLPADDQVVYIRRRNIIVVVEEGEEEVDCDHVDDDLNTETITPKKDNAHQECITKFCALEDEAILTVLGPL